VNELELVFEPVTLLPAELPLWLVAAPEEAVVDAVLRPLPVIAEPVDAPAPVEPPEPLVPRVPTDPVAPPDPLAPPEPDVLCCW